MRKHALDADADWGGAGFTVTSGSPTAGAFSFTIQGTDGTLTHTTVTETLTVGTDVTWTDTGSATATVAAVQSASYTFSAVPAGGAAFSSAVSFGCTGLPALTSCGFSPAAIAAGAGTTTVTLTIGTTAASSARPASLHTAWTSPGGRPFAIFWAAMVGIVGLGRKRGGIPRLYGRMAGVFLGLGLVALISCGGVAGSGGGTPPGTSNVTVSATATGGTAHGSLVTLIVQ